MRDLVGDGDRVVDDHHELGVLHAAVLGEARLHDVELHRLARLRAEAPVPAGVPLDGARGLAQSRAPTAGFAPRSRSTRTSTLPTWRVATANGPTAIARSRAAGVSLTMRQPPSGSGSRGAVSVPVAATSRPAGTSSTSRHAAVSE